LRRQGRELDSVNVCLEKKELILKGIPTQWAAEKLVKDLSELLLTKDEPPTYYFEGSPGPAGEGLNVRIKVKGLGSSELTAIEKYFNLKRVKVLIQCD